MVIVRVALKVSKAREGDAVVELERLSVGEEDPDTVAVGRRGVAVALPPVLDKVEQEDGEKVAEREFVAEKLGVALDG